MQKVKIIFLATAISLATILTGISASAQTATKPKLVVAIIIDQLNGEDLDLISPQLCAGGFRRLSNSGVSITDADFGREHPDAVAGTSIIMTGAQPRINGIPAAEFFNCDKRVESLTLADTRFMGNFTAEAYSPAAIRVSTLADEVRIANNGLGHVHAVAADAQTAVALAGHAANSAFWISDSDGKWATSTYYKDVPQSIQNRNYRNPLASRLDTMSWTPLLPLTAYSEVPTSGKFYGFRHSFAKTDPLRYRAFKQSALANAEVTDVALELLSSLRLGRRGELDMLCIGLSAAPYGYADDEARLQLHDKYIRLDRDLERILSAIDRSVGLANAVVMVTANGNFTPGKAPDASFGIPTGEFRTDRAVSLLNMYLIAVYGNGNWVLGCHNRNFFLNRELIKQHNLDLTAVRTTATDFLRKMSGVMAAYSLDDIISNPVNDDLKTLYDRTLPEFAGDITVRVMPGWIVTEIGRDAQPHSTYVRAVSATMPAFILAPGLTPQRLTGKTDARSLAPSVSRLLRIPAPNAAQCPAIL